MTVICFAVFTLLTVVSAALLFYRLAKAPPAQLPSGNRFVLPANADPGLQEIADAIKEILDALGTFGATLDRLGPTALLGVFTAFFSLGMFASAWLSKLL